MLSLALLGLAMVRIANQQGIESDFFEHSAAVRELATHLLQPRHPELLIDAPHAFFSPYTLAAGLVSRLSGLDAVSTLLVLGPLNLVLFLLAFYWFVASLTGSRRTPALALLCMLLLWGDEPWPSSGFYHLEALGSVIYYPSTFAMSLTLGGLACTLRYLSAGGWRALAVVALGAPVILIIHPVTAGLFYVFVAAIWLGRFTRTQARRFVLLATVIPLASLLALAWPFYPFLELLKAPDPAFDQASRVFGEAVLERTFPAWLGLPLIALRLRRDRRDPLGLAFLMLLMVEVGAMALGRWGFTRVISYLALVSQIAVADWAAERRPNWRAPLPIRAATLLLYIGIVGGLLFSLYDFRTYLARSLRPSRSSYEAYTFLARFSGQYEVVLSDPHTSLYVPSFGGKVVALNKPLHFVADAAARRRDVDDFFDNGTLTDHRLAIFRHYGVDWLLVNTAEGDITNSTLVALRRLGEVVYTDNTRKLTLIRVAAGG